MNSLGCLVFKGSICSYKLLLSLNQQNIEHKHKINLLEKEIEKYKDIIQSCQKNYIDLSYEYSNIKANLEKYIRNNNINKKGKKL